MILDKASLKKIVHSFTGSPCQSNVYQDHQYDFLPGNFCVQLISIYWAVTELEHTSVTECLVFMTVFSL